MARLQDLYKSEAPLTIGPEGDTETVIVRKLSGPEMEASRRRGRAAQALITRAKNDHESEEFLEQLAEVQALFGEDRAQLIHVIVESLLGDEMGQVYARIMLEEDSEWAKDGYLESLQDAWEDSLGLIWAREPENEDACRVKAELDRFLAQVDSEIDIRRRELTADWELADTAKLQDKAAETFFEQIAIAKWNREFLIARTYYSTRTVKDHGERYFSSVDEVAECEDHVLQRLIDKYEEISVGVMEGKDSPSPQNSSPPQEPGEAADTPTSGLQAVAG